jgi:hypothetical protein
MKEFMMDTALTHRRRSLLPALNLLLASAAAVLAVVAITSDDVGSATPTSTSPAATIVGPAHPLGAPTVGIPCDELVFTRC